MIVLGSRGLGNIGSLLLGSTSQKVNHLAPCTVVTVR
jgi:nucleotide-binding universal stress UspA family protein